MIQNQLEISRQVDICINGFLIMELWKSKCYEKKKLKPATLLKVIHLHRCFPRFLNCTNDTKSRKASQMVRMESSSSLFEVLYEKTYSKFTLKHLRWRKWPKIVFFLGAFLWLLQNLLGQLFCETLLNS